MWLFRLYDGKILCDFANEIKSGAVSELVSQSFGFLNSILQKLNLETLLNMELHFL